MKSNVIRSYIFRHNIFGQFLHIFFWIVMVKTLTLKETLNTSKFLAYLFLCLTHRMLHDTETSTDYKDERGFL